MSLTDCLEVALVWSSVPPDWRRTALFVPGSSVAAFEGDIDPCLDLGQGSSWMTLGDVLKTLRFGEEAGITEEEVERIFNYCHNRITGKAKGGPFNYIFEDEDGNILDPDDLPLSFISQATLFSEAREDFPFASDPMEFADRIKADTFIFADAPAVQRVATRLGYVALRYTDVFEAGPRAAKDLWGGELKKSKCMSETFDLNDELMPSHKTLRPLKEGLLRYLWSKPASDVILMVELDLKPSEI